MSNFKIFLESVKKWNLKVETLRGLAAEAMKAPSLQEFAKDFTVQIKHGLYWHLADDPNFQIDLNKGPRDMSSLSSGTMTPGALMVTSHLANWIGYGNRQYVALIDMTDVPRDKYYQVNRGFGNEFYVSDPSKARVIKVYNKNSALAFTRRQHKYLPQSFDELQDFYNFVKGKDEHF